MIATGRPVTLSSRERGGPAAGFTGPTAPNSTIGLTAANIGPT